MNAQTVAALMAVAFVLGLLVGFFTCWIASNYSKPFGRNGHAGQRR